MLASRKSRHSFIFSHLLTHLFGATKLVLFVLNGMFVVEMSLVNERVV